MGIETPRGRARGRWTEEQEAALAALHAAVRHAEEHVSAESRHLVRLAVDAARDVGTGWTRIGDVLGIASGNAYRRYRKRLPAGEDS